MSGTSHDSFLERYRRHRFRMLFVCLIAMALLAPVIQLSTIGHILFLLLLALNLLASVLAVSARKTSAYFAASLLFIAFAASVWSTFFRESLTTSEVSQSIADGAVFVAFVFAATLMLKRVISDGPVDTEKIFAALCVYLLAGIAWGLLYVLVFLNDADAFYFAFNEPVPPEASGETAKLFPMFGYFSFVTMTTLGYGDIAPANDLTRTLAWLQAVLGQLYVAVLIARLVGMHAQVGSTVQDDDVDNSTGAAA